MVVAVVYSRAAAAAAAVAVAVSVEALAVAVAADIHQRAIVVAVADSCRTVGLYWRHLL